MSVNTARNLARKIETTTIIVDDSSHWERDDRGRAYFPKSDKALGFVGTNRASRWSTPESAVRAAARIAGTGSWSAFTYYVIPEVRTEHGEIQWAVVVEEA